MPPLEKFGDETLGNIGFRNQRYGQARMTGCFGSGFSDRCHLEGTDERETEGLSAIGERKDSIRAG